MLLVMFCLLHTLSQQQQLADLIANSTENLVEADQPYELTRAEFQKQGQDYLMTAILSYVTPGTTSGMQERRQVLLSAVTEVTVHGAASSPDQRAVFVLIKYRPHKDGAFTYKTENQQDFGTITAFRLGTYTPADARTIAARLTEMVIAARKSD